MCLVCIFKKKKIASEIQYDIWYSFKSKSDTRMLCTERHVRKGTELAQVSFDPAAVFDACEINREIYIDKYGKVILPIFVIQVHIFISMWKW